MTNSMESFVHCAQSTIRGNISSRFASNSEVLVSELLENLEEIFLRLVFQDFLAFALVILEIMNTCFLDTGSSMWIMIRRLY